MRYSHVLWDWNGTLIDDMECSLTAVNIMLSKRNKSSITREQYFEYIDTPIRRFYENIFDFSEISMTEIMEDFNLYYSLHIGEFPLMSGAREVLEELNKKGATQIILSSSSNDIILPFSEKIKVKHFFEHILGASDSYVNGKIERAVCFISDNDINPKSCVLIGDTLHDYETAAALGCDCILIPNGHQARADLIATGAIVAKDISFVPNLLI
ncbi:MAG: hypothetical protein CVU97_02710 [Firmicutes bacterium HGW-Firmicutes-21]|nr:MAG: hypothetical protein CVU97_02710 [Firmicutes bacterium HGW-Firmicutes-21]